MRASPTLTCPAGEWILQRPLAPGVGRERRMRGKWDFFQQVSPARLGGWGNVNFSEQTPGALLARFNPLLEPRQPPVIITTPRTLRWTPHESSGNCAEATASSTCASLQLLHRNKTGYWQKSLYFFNLHGCILEGFYISLCILQVYSKLSYELDSDNLPHNLLQVNKQIPSHYAYDPHQT